MGTIHMQTTSETRPYFDEVIGNTKVIRINSSKQQPKGEQ